MRVWDNKRITNIAGDRHVVGEGDGDIGASEEDVGRNEAFVFQRRLIEIDAFERDSLRR